MGDDSSQGDDPSIRSLDDFDDYELCDPDGTPLTKAALARSIDEAMDDLNRNGPVPAEEVRRMILEVFQEFEEEQQRLHGTSRSAL